MIINHRCTKLLGYVVLIGLFGFFVLNTKIAQASSLILPPNNIGLIGYWPMNEGAGATTFDKGSGGLTGTLTNGASWVGGKLGKGIAFDGVNDYLNLGANYNFTSETFTISYWVYLNTFHTNKYPEQLGTPVIFKGGWQSNGYYDYIDDTGAVSFATNQYLASQGSATGAGAVSLNAWTHVSYVRVGATITIYVNGVDRTSSHGVHVDPLSSAKNFEVGSHDSTGYGFFMNGMADDVRIYSRALSGHEIMRLYQQGSAKRASVDTKGLVGYWRFNEGSGTTAVDVGSGRNNGTLTNGPTWITGKYGKGLSFDGSDDYVNVPDAAPLRITGDITIAAWINPTDFSNYNGIVGKTNGGSPNPYDYYIVSSGEGGAQGKPRFLESGNVDATNALTPGVWQHIAVTLSGSTVTHYLNGAPNGTGSVSNASDQGTDVRIGSRVGGGTLMKGKLDDVRIYNRALSATEIANLYNDSSASRITKINTSSAGISNGLVGWWTFDGADLNTTTSTDRSGQGNNGTLSGGPQPARGRRGQALRFDGVDDYVSVSVEPAYGVSATSMGVSLWAYVDPSSFDTTVETLLDSASGVPNANNGFFIVLDDRGGVNQATNGLLISFKTATGAVYAANSDNIFPSAGWYHIAVGYTSGVGSVYINGVAQAVNVDVAGSGNYIPRNSTLNIGTLNGGGYYFSKKMDDVRIYNRALSAGEVLQLYNMGK